MENFMKSALAQAEKAAQIGEVPIGAIIVKDSKIIARGYNKREYKKNALYHAEIIAIEKACKKLNSWRLSGCELYVTLEPCPMCMGAIINSRIDKVYFGAYDKKAGSCGSIINLNDYPYNHHPEITGSILQNECSSILSTFFANLRKQKKN
ncbi:MAG: tRNA adenosine(34) deaminase TadA [Eubacteriales bacterium]|nr:tRNA adenosine(34) deaminase TadA [Eubacteriales bacterium]